MVPDGGRSYMGQTVRFQDTLRRLAMIDEGFVEDQQGESARTSIPLIDDRSPGIVEAHYFSGASLEVELR